MFGKIFNPDNPVLTFINRSIDLVILSIIWTVCCLPIVTIGPASCALYYSIVKCVRQQRSYAIREFFTAFKDNCKKGIVVNGFLILLTVSMLITDFPLMMTFYDSEKIQNHFVFILFCVKVFLLLGSACWIYPLLSRFDEKLLKLAMSALFLSVRYFWITLPIILLFFLAVSLIRIEWLLLAVLPGIFMLLISLMVEPVLQKVTEEKE